jgi:hypothetical protein
VLENSQSNIIPPANNNNFLVMCTSFDFSTKEFFLVGGGGEWLYGISCRANTFTVSGCKFPLKTMLNFFQFYYVYILFNDATSSLVKIASNDRTIDK